MTDPFDRLVARTDPVHEPDPEQAARIEERMHRAFAHDDLLDAQHVSEMSDHRDRAGRPAKWSALVASLVLVIGGLAVWLTTGRSTEDAAPAASDATSTTSLPAVTSPAAPAADGPGAADWIRIEPGTTWRFTRIVGTTEFQATQPIGLVVDSVVPATIDGLQTASARFRSDAGDGVVLGDTTLIIDPNNAQLAFPAVFLDPTLDLLACGSPVVAVQATADGRVDASPWPRDASQDSGVCTVEVTAVTVDSPTTVTLPSLEDPTELDAVPVTIEWQLDGTERTTTWWITLGNGPDDGLVAIDLDATDSEIDIARTDVMSDG